MSVKVRLVDDNGHAINKNLVLAPVNNTLNSLFKSVSIELNGTSVTKNPASTYADYIQKLVGYGTDPKHAWMQSMGWYEDETGYFDPVGNMQNNAGFTARRQLFRKRYLVKTPGEPDKHEWRYHTNWVSFAGKLHTDLKSNDIGIPPGVAVNIEIETNSDDFRLICTTPNANAYLEIGKATLHIPVGTLNTKLYQKLTEKWATEDIKMFYQRTSVVKHNIGVGERVYFASNAFKGNDTGPCRVFFFFLLNKQMYPRDKTTNPFKLVRKFPMGTDPETYCYVEKFDLEINNQKLDTICTEATEDDDIHSFLKFNMVNNSDSSPRACLIDYQKWMDNSALWGFDLSASSKCADDYWVPSILSGTVSVRVQFSCELPYGVSLMCFQEIPSLTTISKKGKIMNSFFVGV